MGNLPPDEIAGHIGLRKYGFPRLFHKHSGMTPQGHIVLAAAGHASAKRLSATQCRKPSLRLCDVEAGPHIFPNAREPSADCYLSNPEKTAILDTR